MKSKPQQTEQCFERKVAQLIRARYLLYLPREYEAGGPQRWPLLLFLHGSGERGNNLAKVSAHGPPRLVRRDPDFPFIVASPQCPSGQCWSNDVLLPLLDELEHLYLIDPARIYLTGLSMGGYGVWSLSLAAPERFAAIAPICGGGDALSLLLADRTKLQALRTLGVWAFHGAKDPVVRLEESEKMVEAFRRIGNNARLTVYPEAGHDSWAETYRNPALYKWLLEHQRHRPSKRRLR